MAQKYTTEQEEFWSKSFGDDYIDRNTLEQEHPARLSLFSRIFQRIHSAPEILEFGANIGNNLVALHRLFPNATLKAIEINEKAATHLKSQEWISDVVHGSILDYDQENVADLTFTSGVLIHINPDYLPKVYDALHRASRRYVMVCEYYNPAPVVVPYRGHQDRLFKRDFAGDLMNRFPDLKLIDYGFVYHRDNHFGLDDLNWFLMEKNQG